MQVTKSTGSAKAAERMLRCHMQHGWSSTNHAREKGPLSFANRWRSDISHMCGLPLCACGSLANETEEFAKESVPSESGDKGSSAKVRAS